MRNKYVFLFPLLFSGSRPIFTPSLTKSIWSNVGTTQRRSSPEARGRRALTRPRARTSCRARRRCRPSTRWRRIRARTDRSFWWTRSEAWAWAIHGRSSSSTKRWAIPTDRTSCWTTWARDDLSSKTWLARLRKPVPTCQRRPRKTLSSCAHWTSTCINKFFFRPFKIVLNS